MSQNSIPQIVEQTSGIIEEALASVGTRLIDHYFEKLEKLASAKPKIIRLSNGAVVVSEIADFSSDEGVTAEGEPCQVVTIFMKSGHPVNENDLDGRLMNLLYKQYEEVA
jgi:hypothetical protein